MGQPKSSAVGSVASVLRSRAPLLFGWVPPAGFVPQGNADDLRFSRACWSCREVLSFRGLPWAR